MNRTRCSALGALTTVAVLSGCIGASPDTLAPVALQRDGQNLRVAFCDSFQLGGLEISQRLLVDGRLGDWDKIYSSEIDTEVARFDVLDLSSRDHGEPELDRLGDLIFDDGTRYLVTVVVEDEGETNYHGRYTSPGASWVEELWLPTQSGPTETPCEFWDDLTGRG